MNKLILLGNGFDLAHGLETSYNDFLLNYLSNCVNTFYQNNNYKDNLIEIKFKQTIFTNGSNIKRVTKENVIEFIKTLNSNENISLKICIFLDILIKKVTIKHWIDVEKVYYFLLKTQKNGNKDKIEILNNQLESFRDIFILYLKKLNYDPMNYEPIYNILFRQKIKLSEIPSKNSDKEINANETYYLNFNYTPLLKNLYQPIDNNNPDKDCVIHIHGDINIEYGEPIFGYGDELDEDYLSFEKNDNNELFKHIKSFEYSLRENYHKLLKFLNHDEFQIQIFGHSCGVSDRTLLNHIFEHPNCVSIKIFYYVKPNETDDFKEKTYEISRHFTDKKAMREKIVPKPLCERMPQII